MPRRKPRGPDGERIEPDPAPTDGADRFIRKGGKVDPEAIRAAMSSHTPGNAEASDDTGVTEGDHWPEGDAPELRTVSFSLQRDLNKRLDRYLVDRITFMSRSQLQRLIEDGGVTVNGRGAKASTKLRKGDAVEVVVPPPPSTEIQPDAMPIAVLYEDEHMLAINKQPDLIVHPARSHNRGTLLNGLVHYFMERNAQSDEDKAGESESGLSSVGKDLARPGIVHRLDRDTSGVMIIAKSDTAHWRLARQFERRETDKRYLALVHGIVEIDADVIDVPLGPSPSRAKGAREKQAVRRDHLGKPAVTLYRVRERFRSPAAAEADELARRADAQRDLPPHQRDPELAKLMQGPPARPANIADKGFTLVELELKTGRTHQIRVHLAHLGYPIVADDMYGGVILRRGHILPNDDDAGGSLLARQALHAAVLGLRHPITAESIEFTAPLPDDLLHVVRLLREGFASEGPQTPPGATIDLASAVPV